MKHMSTVPLCYRKGCWMSYKCSYRYLRLTIWVLGIILGYSGRPVGLLSIEPSLTPLLYFSDKHSSELVLNDWLYWLSIIQAIFLSLLISIDITGINFAIGFLKVVYFSVGGIQTQMHVVVP